MFFWIPLGFAVIFTEILAIRGVVDPAIPWLMIGTIAAALVLFAILIGLMPFIGFVDALTLDMEDANLRYGKTGKARVRPYLFAEIPHGRLVIVIRGGKIRYCLMNDPTKCFARKGSNIQHPDYWELNERADSEPTEPPFPYDPWTPWGWMKLYVYWMTGKVFTGVFPFQQLHLYELEKLEIFMPKKEDIDEKDAAHREGTYAFEVKRSISDHLRTRRFNRYVKAADNETSGLFQATAVLNLQLETRNPVTAAFGTDAWFTTVDNQARDVTRRIFKEHDLDYLAGDTRPEKTTEKKEKKKHLEKELASKLCKELGKHLSRIAGMHLDPKANSVQVLDVIVQITTEELGRIRNKKLAQYDRDAMLTKADGEAGRERKMIAAQRDELAKDPAMAALIMSTRASVESAKAGKNVTVFVGSQGGDTTSRAVLDTLQRLERGRDDRPPHGDEPNGTITDKPRP